VAARIAALRRFRERGVESVAVVSPLWPVADVELFARRLEEAADFVVLDHYLIGDGSRDGARTRRRLAMAGMSFPELLARAGYEEWTRLDSLERVKEAFLRVLGPERIGVSKEGFHRAAHRLLAPRSADAPGG
jgi:hypothetical protein